MQRIMIAMEKAGAVRRDGKSTAVELGITPPESERQILRCAPPFDAQAEHENDLRQESRVDYESWQRDGCDGPEDCDDDCQYE